MFPNVYDYLDELNPAHQRALLACAVDDDLAYARFHAMARILWPTLDRATIVAWFDTLCDDQELVRLGLVVQ